MFYYYSYIILTKNVFFSSKKSYFHSYSPYTALAINGTLPQQQTAIDGTPASFVFHKYPQSQEQLQCETSFSRTLGNKE